LACQARSVGISVKAFAGDLGLPSVSNLRAIFFDRKPCERRVPMNMPEPATTYLAENAQALI
jgi:hypothetical protein